MTIGQFFLIYAMVLATMALCRLVPIFALRGRTLSAQVVRVLDLIPIAAFASLVANDLFQPLAWAEGPTWSAWIPLIAAAGVIVIARWTRSLIWCAIAGLEFYLILTALPF